VSVPSTLEAGRVVAGRYRIERQIGAGGVGSVYLVRHLHTDEQLALKVLQKHALADASAVERFRKEARAPARIGGEHVTRVTDADTAPDLGNAPFLVMELLRGRDLTQVVEQSGPLAPPMVLELLRQAARALDRAHALGIVHRDLKPDNLFLTERDDGSPCIKLLDFGIARIGDAAPSEMKTQAGLVFGTPGYMAPEQMTGEVDLVSSATDVWALGLVAFYLLVGRDFWDAATLGQLYARILGEPIPRPSQRGSRLGEPFDLWFARAVVREPGQRFQSASEAVDALAVALGLRISVRPVSLPPLDRVEAPPRLPAAPVVLSAPASPGPAFGLGRVVALVAAAGVVVIVGGVVVAWTVLIPSGGAGDAAGSAPASTASAAKPSANPERTPLASADPRSTAAPVVPSAAPSEAPPRTADPADPVAAPPALPVAGGRPAWDPHVRGNTREQQERLDALQRLCDQGTVTAAECAAKRGAILRGDP
jgi:serine/threonine-protein kinase